MHLYEIMVSIIIPTYNHEKYIEKAIRSVLMQKTKYSFEVLIGEDHSSDRTSDVLRKLSDSLPGNFFIFYRDRNYGAFENGKDLYGRAKGKYLILLEGDDYWTNDLKLEKQIDFLEMHPDYVAVAHNTEVVDKYGNVRKDYFYPECKNEEYTIYDYEDGILMGQSTTILFRNYITYKLFDDIKISVNYPGDRRKNFLFVTHGKVKCIQEKWSAYRYVETEGSSYSATVKNDKTIQCRELVFYRELKTYADLQLNAVAPKIVAQNLYLMCGLGTCIFRRNPEYYWKEWLYDFYNARYKNKFLIYFIKRLKRKLFN